MKVGISERGEFTIQDGKDLTWMSGEDVLLESVLGQFIGSLKNTHDLERFSILLKVISDRAHESAQHIVTIRES